MYFLGGEFGTDPWATNVVYYAPINTNGSLGAWTTTTFMTNVILNGRSYFETVVYNNYIYVIGGLDQDSLGYSAYSDVIYAPFNSNGTLGSWSSTTGAGIRYRGAAVASNGYIYLIGGSGDGSTSGSPDATVRSAAINSDGTLGSWQAIASLQTPRVDFDAVAYNGTIYAVAGYSSTVLSDIESATVLPGGTLGSWIGAGTLSSPYNKLSATVVRGNLYVVGGSNNITRYQTIEYGPLNTIPRVARYSKLIDLGSTVSLSGFTFNGIVQGGAANILFRSAGTDGLFNTAASINTLSGSGTGSVCGTGGGGGGTRYVWLTVTMDDSGAGSGYADTVGIANGAVTDLSVDYAGGGQHPTPQQRMRGGKFFQTEALQPLDTCGP
jgi:hypothetical protein